MAGIGIILNPFSKQHRKDPDKMTRMSYIVGDKGSCKQTTDLQDLRRVAEEYKTRDVEVLAIAGGDGTIHVVLTAFIQSYGEKPLPKIALLRGGTMNNVANALKKRGSPEKLLSNLIHKYHEDIPFDEVGVDMMKINNEFGFLFGCGMVYRFLDEYYKTKGLKPSPQKAAVLVARGICSCLGNGGFACRLFRPFEAKVTIDGKTWPYKNYSTILTGAVSTLGLGTQVFPKAAEPGHFHAIAFSSTPRNFIFKFPKIVSGKDFASDGFLSEGFKKLSIQLSEPCPYYLDGDMLEATDRIDISIGPRITVIS